MYLQEAERSASMETAHLDKGVIDAAAAFLRCPSDGMLKLLGVTIQARYDTRSHRQMILPAGIPTEAHDTAYEFLEAMNRIWDDGKPDSDYCRGALFEQIARGMLDRRPDSPAVLSEQRVGPFPSPWPDELSDPIDFVLPDAPEFYECKVGVHHIASKHLEQFRIIKGLDALSMTAFVTLAKAATLVDFLAEFNRPAPPETHAFTFEDFLAMADRPAQNRVA
jgi:hypothetical protein